MAVNSELNEESLFAHNYLRERHGCPPLQYDEELAKSSQAFANKLAHSPRLKYYYPTDYGENVAYRVRSRDANLTGIEATLRWYREILNFIFGRENQAKCVELYKEAMAEKSGDKESYEDYVKSILDALNSIRVGKKLPPLLLNPKTRRDLSKEQEQNEDDQNSQDNDEQTKILRSKLIDPTRIARLMLRNGQVIREDIMMVGITVIPMPQSSTVVIVFK
ncbi:unnamed protein product [Taenia asiatica]|uniref:SCP domain-containing protein n=1 Tax=Taenia asiatica TaxID=60517 RepID=A0A158R7Y0_TAEAS|nr:unnamed protein product [Taenia asiatica]